MARRLEGAGLVLTRPAAPDDELAARLRAEGARALSFPAQQLEAVPGPPPAGEYDVALFTSPAAVRFGLARLAAALPPLLAATGEGTARRLAAAGVRRVLQPEAGAGVAALLAGVGGRLLAGRRVLVVCGRPVRRRSLVLLRACCAELQVFAAYRRRPVTEPEPLSGWLRSGKADAIMASSTAAVRALTALPGIEWGEITWIVSSERVAQAVQRSARVSAVTAASAQDADLIAAAIGWWPGARGAGSDEHR